MLNETPLGAMLEEVAAQLVDKALTFMPNHRLSGPEIVKLAREQPRGAVSSPCTSIPRAPKCGRLLCYAGP